MQRRPLRFVGVLAALVGLVGYVALGWRFGESGSGLSSALGVAFFVLALGWTVYRRV